MKSKIFVLILVLAIIIDLNCQNTNTIELKLINDAILYPDKGSLTTEDRLLELDAGTIVYGERISYLGNIDNNRCYLAVINYDTKNYKLLSNALVLANTSTLFPNDYLTLDASKDAEIWIPAFNLDIVSGQSKEIVNKYYGKINEYLLSHGRGKYKISSNFVISQISISLSYLTTYHYWIHNIEKKEGGYLATVEATDRLKRYYEQGEYQEDYLLDLPTYRERRTFGLLFVKDNKYMNIYLDDINHPLAEMILVDSDFYYALWEEVYSNFEADISNLNWPTRADGSMDYPIRNPKLLPTFKPTHTLTNDLKMRAKDSIDSAFFATLPKGEEVQLIEKGSTDTIDGITAPWYHVLTSKGYYGWCFGGSVKEVTNDLVYLVPMIIGIVVLLIVIAIIMSKKKNKNFQ
ncbi:SH3 domain-containing protein [Spirochaeta cellobiosiphila]|uniref:SH3 domain-containing protein n=1 Tax=Spirochaeta cellobiosiphila TaxID=504483 RepID=UPI00048D0ECC|nr:SH3 domain-containing protein [Spirochaeta cellobiosiphila]